MKRTEVLYFCRVALPSGARYMAHICAYSCDLQMYASSCTTRPRAEARRPCRRATGSNVRVPVTQIPKLKEERCSTSSAVAGEFEQGVVGLGCARTSESCATRSRACGLESHASGRQGLRDGLNGRCADTANVPLRSVSSAKAAPSPYVFVCLHR